MIHCRSSCSLIALSGEKEEIISPELDKNQLRKVLFKSSAAKMMLVYAYLVYSNVHVMINVLFTCAQIKIIRVPVDRPSQFVKLNTNGLNSGTYILQVSTGKKVMTRKIVKH